MKLIFTILLSMSVAISNATNYYIDNAGNNSNAGTSSGSAWATISKVNGFSFISGDSILLKRGGIWNEKLIVPNSNINFGAYGTGANPIITGFQSQAVSLITGNIYRGIAINSVSNLNLVLINGFIAHKGRFPNTGWLTFTSYSGDSVITGTLTGNHAGFQLAVRTVPWIIDTISVLSQSGGTLNLNGHLTYPPAYGGNGYFLQNDSTLVDTLNEFSYNQASKALVIYSAITPTVSISTIDTLVYVGSKNGVTFNNIQFQGANKLLISLDGSNNTVINNCNLNYCGGNGVESNSHAVATTYNTDTIHNILNTGISNVGATLDSMDSVIITNNYIKNIGFIAGMGRNSNSQGNGIEIFGNLLKINGNRIDSCGNNCLEFVGRNDTIYHNYCTNWAFIKSDAGALRTAIGVTPDQLANLSDSLSLIRANICDNGIGAPSGTQNGVLMNSACGIYLDENANYLKVDSNSVSNIFESGIFLHDVAHDSILANTVFGGINSYALVVAGVTSVTHTNTIKQNLLFALPSQGITYRDAADNTESIDSNYISRWPSEGYFMYNQGSMQTLPIWAGATTYDVHSKVAPVNITYDTPIFYSNPTKLPVVYTPLQTMTDFYNNSANTFTLAPYKSVILFTSLNQILPIIPPSNTIIKKAHFKIKSL